MKRMALRLVVLAVTIASLAFYAGNAFVGSTSAQAATKATLIVQEPQASQEHNSRWTLNTGYRWYTKSQWFSTAKAYLDMGRKAATACGSLWAGTAANLAYATRLTPVTAVASGWAFVVYQAFGFISGNSFCHIAYEASKGAAWASYFATQGGGYSYIKVQHYDRHYANDLCRTWHSMSSSQSTVWRVDDLKTAIGYYGKCPGESS